MGTEFKTECSELEYRIIEIKVMYEELDDED